MYNLVYVKKNIYVKSATFVLKSKKINIRIRNTT